MAVWCILLLNNDTFMSLLIEMELSEITSKWQNDSFMSNERLSSSISNIIIQITKMIFAKLSIRFNLLQVCPSVPPFVFAVLFISSIHVLSCYFYVALSLVAQQFQ